MGHNNLNFIPQPTNLLKSPVCNQYPDALQHLTDSHNCAPFDKTPTSTKQNARYSTCCISYSTGACIVTSDTSASFMTPINAPKYKPNGIKQSGSPSPPKHAVSFSASSWALSGKPVSVSPRLSLKGGSEDEFMTARSSVNSMHSLDQPDSQDDMMVMFQNVRSFARRQVEVERTCTQQSLNHVVLLECFKSVEWDYFEYRHNSNLFSSPVGRNSIGIYVSSTSPIYKCRNPVGDFLYYKVDGVWFMVVYISKNNTFGEDRPPPGDPAGHEFDENVDIQEEEDTTTQLTRGRQRILDTIRNLFLTQNKVVLMGDWNGLKDFIVEFMEDLHATRLDTDPSYSALRNGAACHNDLIFTRGLSVELVKQGVRGSDTFSDHDQILFKIRNIKASSGKLKMFPKLLKDEQLLAQWKQAVEEFNRPNYLGRQFTADKVYESINFASDMTRMRNVNQIHKKRAKYTPDQFSRIHELTALYQSAEGEERKRASRRLGNFKYRCRRDNWREFIRGTIRERNHWRLFKSMDRNNTILNKRKVKDNILANRKLQVQKWVDDLSDIYSRKDLPPLPDEFNELNNVDLEACLPDASDIEVNQADVDMALKKTKVSTSSGQNQIGQAFLKQFFAADPEFFTLCCRHEINNVESVEDFKVCRFVPIFKNKPNNERSNPRHQRLIAIMDCFQKVLEAIVINKLVDSFEEQAGIFQHGSVRAKGSHTAYDMHFQHAQQYKAKNTVQYTAQIDIEKAYPSVDPDLMVKLLVLRIGNFKQFHKVHKLMLHSTALLDLGFALIPISIHSGLKEGSKLSCAFWNLLAGEIISKLDLKHNLGLRHIPLYIGAINRVTAQIDDLKFSTESKRDMELLLEDLVTYTAPFGLKINQSDGKSNFMVHNFSPDRVPNKDPLKLSTSDGVKHILQTEEYIWLGFGIKAEKPLSVEQHLKIRNVIRDKDGYFTKLRRLRQVFKGDVAIIRDLINQFWVARFQQGVNKMIRTLDQFQQYFDGMTVDNWFERPEPAFIQKLNQELATAAAKIAPGNALNYLCCATLALRPFQVRHLGEKVRKEDIRDYWLAKSNSRMKGFILNHWSNICTVLKNRNFPQVGRRHFIAVCMGHVSLSLKLGKQEGEECMCGQQFNLPNALDSLSYDICGWCSLHNIPQFGAPKTHLVSDVNRDFINAVGDLLTTRFFSGWAATDQ